MNTSNSCISNFSYPGEEYITFSLYGLLFTIGFTLNILALWVFCFRMKKWTETRVYMINLAVADTCLILLLPIVAYFTFASCFDDLSCQIPQGIYLVNAYMSISIPMIIGVDRYVAIKYPLKAKVLRTPGRAAIICALLWAVVISLLTFRVMWQIQDGAFCFAVSLKIHHSVVVFSFLGFFVPLGILVFCTFQIVYSLLRFQGSKISEVRQIRKSVSMVLASLLVFVICFLPLHTTILLNYFLGSRLNFKMVFRIVTFLAHTNCCLDAICYYFVAKEFQDMTPFFRSRQPRPTTHQDKQTCTTLI